MASNSYIPPGVSVTEVVDPTISPVLATPTSVALVGPVTVAGSVTNAGVITTTDFVTLSGATAVELPTVADLTVTMSSTSIVSVTDATSPGDSEALTNGVYPSGEGGYVFDSTAHTIRRGNTNSVITSGHVVKVVYTYSPSDYFSAIRAESLADITRRFGDAYTADGDINCVLSYAATCAFENGASDVVLQPLFFNNAGVRQQPTSAQVAASTTWSDNFVALRDIDVLNLIVPVVGQSFANIGDAEQISIIKELQNHIKFMKDTEQQHIIGVVGEDSSASSTEATEATLRTHALDLAGRYGGDVASNIVFVAPSRFTRPKPSAATSNLTVGGQYVAAAIAGMISSRPVSQSLTRKIVSGFNTVAETRTKSGKNTDAASGLMVIEQKGGSLVVRHGVTIATTGVTRRELSLVRAKHRVIESVRDTLETQIVGEVIADGDAPFIVQSAVIGVLEELRGAGDIVDYGDVQARTKSLDPSEVEVRFSYRPAVPVNNVSVGFSLDLTTGDLTIADTADVNTSTF